MAALSLLHKPLAAPAATKAVLNVPRYSAGDVATEDIVATMPLVVFDPVRTEALRKVEAQKVPPIFRRLPDGPEQTERALRDAFEARRTDFVARLSAQFGHPVPLLTVEVAQPAFAEVTRAFQAAHPEFPLSRQLVELWAFGNAGDAMLDTWRTRLRQLTAAYAHIRSDVLPDGERLTTPFVRVIEVETAERTLTLAAVERQGRNFARTNLVPISRIRQEAKQGAPANANRDAEELTTEFIVSFLSPNYLFDSELTQQARARRTAEIHVADRYAAGDLLVKAGDVLTPKVLLALEELRSRHAAEQALVAAAVEQSQRAQAETALSMAQATVASATRTNQWLRAGLATAGVLCLWLVWRWHRGQRALSRAAFPADPADFAMTSNPSSDDAAWRERALEAEARAEKATALLRSSLLPHMARWMMNELVQRLLSQRSAMVTSHEKAEKEVADLAHRLDQLHAPLEERLHAYERRIAELEAELAAKGQQNAELIKAKIETTRKKLQVERGQEPLTWN